MPPTPANPKLPYGKNLAQQLQNAWLRRGCVAYLLWPCAQIYGLLLAIRRTLYAWGVCPSHALPVPVVVVGNLVAGGGGKTPLVMALVEHLQARGFKPGVLSRGYGRAAQHTVEVQTGMQASVCGDEPLLIHQTSGVPVFVAAQRLQAGRALLAAHPDVNMVVCDDGLQHHALQRNINIAVFDERGLGNGWLLPAGPLRAPWPRPALAPNNALAASPPSSNPCQPGQIDLVLHTGLRAAFAGFTSSRKLAPQARAAGGHCVALSSLQNQPLVALAGIANPAAFFSMLQAHGLHLSQTIALPDHYDFCSGPSFLKKGTTLICTEKDAVKLFARHPNAGLELLSVALEFAPEAAFLNALDQLLAQRTPLNPPSAPTPSTPLTATHHGQKTT